MFMLDTDTCIYIKKHKPPQVLKKFQTLSPAEVCMSAITFAAIDEWRTQKSTDRT